MKQLTALLLAFGFVSFCQAQIKVDSNYTIMARGINGKADVSPYILGDLNSLMIKEKPTGKICTPVSMQYSFIIQSESFHAQNAKEAQKFLGRLKPKDRVIIDKIILPQNCFQPPKQIEITVN
ncbi:MAG: hypothetical protein ACHQVK_03835 [Candidatus Paceibacterales bacterium]